MWNDSAVGEFDAEGGKMAEVVVEVRRGFVVGVYTDSDDVRVTVVDWDDADHNEGRAHVESLWERGSLGDMSAEVRREYERTI